MKGSLIQTEKIFGFLYWGYFLNNGKLTDAPPKRFPTSVPLPLSNSLSVSMSHLFKSLPAKTACRARRRWWSDRGGGENSNMANIFWCWLGIVTSKDLLSKRFWLQLSQILVEPWHHRAAWKQNDFLENWNCFKLCWRCPLNIVPVNINSCIPGFCPSKQTTCKGIKQTVEI